MEITRGKIASAQKIVIYGPEGIGKSTFASQFPDPVFIDTEGSTKHMDVARFPKPSSWTMLLEEVKQVRDCPSCCKTLVIDTADWAEQLCINHVCSKAKKSGIEDFGYGKGYIYVAEEFGKLLNLLEEIIERNVHVVITAHAKMRKFEQPDEIGSYDRWEMKLTKNVAPLVKEWADMVLFANYKTFVVATDDKGTKHKAQGGSRVMYTSHHPCWDAKNRHNLPLEIPFEYSQISMFIENIEWYQTSVEKTQPAESVPSVPQNETDFEDLSVYADKREPEKQTASAESAGTDFDGIPKALQDLMTANNVTQQDIQWAVSDKGYYPMETPIKNYDPAFIDGVLVGAWKQVFAMIKENKKLPF